MNIALVNAEYPTRSVVDHGGIATYTYVEIPVSKTVEIVPGAPSICVVTAPTVLQIAERFSIRVKLEDVWGNPVAGDGTEVRVAASEALKLAQSRNMNSLASEISRRLNVYRSATTGQ